MILASMAVLTAVLAAPPLDTSHAADVERQTGADAPASTEPTGPAHTQALTRLDERVTAVETATVALVGHPLVDTTKAASRTFFRPELVGATAAPVTSGLTAEQLPDRVLGARQQVASGDVASAARVVEGVETDVLLVALDLGDQSAQNVAMTRLLVSADPQVALLDAAVGATHAAAEVRDVVAAATSAVQARDAAAGITVAAQQISVTGDAEAAEAEAARAEAAKVAGLARSTDGYTNGSIPLKVLCKVAFAPSQRLRCDAAEALARLNAAYRAAFGRDLSISGSYRTLEEQISTRAAKGTMAAVPGTSNHGWGLAIDLNEVTSYRSAQYVWLKANAMTYGWHHPVYMDEGGRGPHEPWHWEFGTSDDAGTGTSVPITAGVAAPTTPPPTSPAPPVVEQPSAAPVEPAPDPERHADHDADAATPAPTPSPSAVHGAVRSVTWSRRDRSAARLGAGVVRQPSALPGVDDVGVHRALRRLGGARLDRREDGLVLTQGLLVERRRRGAVVARAVPRALEQRPGDALGEAVARDLHHDVVEADVGLAEGGGIVERGAHRPERLAQRRELVRRADAGGVRGHGRPRGARARC